MDILGWGFSDLGKSHLSLSSSQLSFRKETLINSFLSESLPPSNLSVAAKREHLYQVLFDPERIHGFGFGECFLSTIIFCLTILFFVAVLADLYQKAYDFGGTQSWCCCYY